MNVLPLPYLADSLNYFLRLQDLPNKVWLDSGSAQHQHGRYDIISAAPKHCVHAMHADELKDEINSSLQKHVTHSELPFCGGWIGYIHYEARHQKYGLPPYRNVEETQADQVFFGWYDWEDELDTCLEAASANTAKIVACEHEAEERARATSKFKGKTVAALLDEVKITVKHHIFWIILPRVTIR